MSNTENRLRQVFSNILAVPESEITDGSSPETVQSWDSLQHMVLISAISEEFSLLIEPEDAMEMLSFALARKTVESLLRARQ